MVVVLARVSMTMKNNNISLGSKMSYFILHFLVTGQYEGKSEQEHTERTWRQELKQKP